ncbi:hypothetical protein FKM82_010038 [Ascaphus truei]
MTPTAGSLLLGLVLCSVGIWAAVTPERAGFCPVIKEQLPCDTVLGAPLCSTDSQCPRNQKCCVSANKMQCVPALKEKPGKCPVPVTRCAFPPPTPKCKSDSQCTGTKKCCTPVCGKQCTDAIIGKWTLQAH